MKKGKKKTRERVRNYPNPPFSEETFARLYERWKNAVGEETLLEEGITKEQLQHTCEMVCTKFPRGTNCGSLLWDPIVDDEDTPMERRGVSMQWLSRALKWMRDALDTQGPTIPTRLFVALFVEPLVLPKQHAQQQETLPLYYFLPLEYRGPPQVFVSHGWDSWLRHLLFYPHASVPGMLAKKRGKQKAFLWLDVFAIVQDPGSTKQQAQVARIGDVVRSIGQSCIVVPGHGCPHFALLPARRSWCCFEIAYTKHLSARVGVNKAFFDTGGVHCDSEKNIGYHQGLIGEICSLKCRHATTHNEEEKKAIQELLDQELGLDQADHMVQKAILRAFYERYNNPKSRFLAKMYRQALDDLEESRVD